LILKEAPLTAHLGILGITAWVGVTKKCDWCQYLVRFYYYLRRYARWIINIFS
jgi:hypothetical protein